MELTNMANTKDWLMVTENIKLSTYVPGGDSEADGLVVTESATWSNVEHSQTPANDLLIMANPLKM